MYIKSEIKDGKTDYGYIKVVEGKEIYFLVVERSAIVCNMNN